MRARAFLIALALILAAVGGLKALERASAEMLRDAETSTQDEASLKPLFLFAMRGRGDPFMPYPVLGTAATPVKAFDINALVFSGTLEVQGQLAALFMDDRNRTYFLRGNCLYDPADKVVPGVHGSIAQTDTDNEVTLTQGGSKLAFTSQRVSKRLAQDSQP
ncbi:MAG TPA: hypothetical protein VK914_03095 [bacterium]|jgi:hypothetical protein|nr:hypothetical protein [bacterium]